MNSCSARSASVSVSVATKSMRSVCSSMSASPRTWEREKCEPTRLRIDLALPT